MSPRRLLLLAAGTVAVPVGAALAAALVDPRGTAQVLLRRVRS